MKKKHTHICIFHLDGCARAPCFISFRILFSASIKRESLQFHKHNHNQMMNGVKLAQRFFTCITSSPMLLRNAKFFVGSFCAKLNFFYSSMQFKCNNSFCYIKEPTPVGGILWWNEKFTQLVVEMKKKKQNQFWNVSNLGTHSYYQNCFFFQWNWREANHLEIDEECIHLLQL